MTSLKSEWINTIAVKRAGEIDDVLIIIIYINFLAKSYLR